MSVSLTDQSRRVIVSFRRSGSQVYVDTWVDGVARESAVSAADLQQLSTFLNDLATTRWSEVPAGPTAPSVERTEPVVSPAGRPTSLPPYPQAARWVPAPSGGIPVPSEGQQSE